MQRQNLQLAGQQTALKLSWNGLDLVHRASRRNCVTACVIATSPKSNGKRWLSGVIRELLQQSSQGGRTLLWKAFNVNSNIYVRGGIFSLSRAQRLGATRVSRRRQPLSLPNATERLFAGDFNGIARDRVEFELSPSIRRASLARPGLFS